MAKIRKDNKGRNLHVRESQRADGRYLYSYMLNGKRKYIYDTDLHRLREKERQIEQDLHDGIRTYEAFKLTLNDLFKTYMATKDTLKKSTISNYMYMWEHYVRDEPVANKPISSIRKSDIKLLYVKLLKNGLSSNTLEGINNLVHPVLQLAVDDDLIRKNPSIGVYHSMKQDRPPPKTALSPEQTLKFLQFTKASDTYRHWLPILITLLGTGMRIGECTGLTWNDVDFESNTISVNHSLGYRPIDGHAEFYITTPKTRKGLRTIPMIPAVSEQLLTLHEKKDCAYATPSPVLNGHSDFVFRNRTGGLLCAHNVNRAITRILNEYNSVEQSQAQQENRKPEPIPHFSAHNLRHTFCTRLCEKESNMAVIQKIMGHSDISTTMGVYNHISQERLSTVLPHIIQDI